jgi:putative transposase
MRKDFLKNMTIMLDKTVNVPSYLSKDEFAEIIKETLHYPDGKDYFLICYCIMPNHVHLVFCLLEHNRGISKIMQSINKKNIFIKM